MKVIMNVSVAVSFIRNGDKWFRSNVINVNNKVSIWNIGIDFLLFYCFMDLCLLNQDDCGFLKSSWNTNKIFLEVIRSIKFTISLPFVWSL